MTDIKNVLATPVATPTIIHRGDYQPPRWLIPDVHLDFALDPARTIVVSKLTLTRNGSHGEPIRLDGEDLELLSVTLNGHPVDHRIVDGQLVVDCAADTATLETRVAISPETNTQLMGLYASSGLLCTQCEAEGFRRITYFPDRPDILSRYTVRMSADRARYPVLLSNGDCTDSNDGPNGTHCAEWTDPFPKPCYLFALVAGDLHANRDTFTTMSGKTVDLAIWVREADLPRTDHAMWALKQSMDWDERAYGREYDLGQFNIVAVDDFNFGAMENKSLNVFNSRYVLADPDTATDLDFDAITGIVAHEYFHNWSGNRVTCRDWFQLSLKEGFTVYRDQSFSGDIGSAAVKRIRDVRQLRAGQFPEDAGPLAHPIRPDSYMEISNFYTATIYDKGAEVIRMMATLLGPDRFRAGSDLYFARNDGTAATCDDFVAAMEEGGGADLSQFRRWYGQAGTPKVKARLSYDAEAQKAILSLSQETPPTPGQPEKCPMVLPLRTKLFDRQSGAPLTEERLIVLDNAQAEIMFDGVDRAPVLSINRGFSAPVVLDAGYERADLALLSAHDDDPFARYEAMQRLTIDTIMDALNGGALDSKAVIEAIAATLNDESLDPAFKAEMLILPSEAYLGEQMKVIDPDAIHSTRKALRMEMATGLFDQWQALYARAAQEDHPGWRVLKAIAMDLITLANPEIGAPLALEQFANAANMTDRQSALVTLSATYRPERDEALAAFYERYRDNNNVLDKWFSVQAGAMRADTPEVVRALLKHPDFTLSNPNRMRSLISMFAGNQCAFHQANGAGYDLLADQILALDKLNPQGAARLVPALGRWKRFDAGRQAKMRAALTRIVEAPGLSKDVFEQASKSLD